MIGSENAGDFHDWPEIWQRSSTLSQDIISKSDPAPSALPFVATEAAMRQQIV
jgi:hypothetical protein